MAVGYDTSTSGEGTSVSSKTVSITVANNRERYLVIHIETGDAGNTVSSVVFNSSETATQLYTIATSTNTIWAYGLANPTATTANVVVTFSGAPNRCSVIVSSFYNVAVANPTGVARTSTGTADTFWVACDGGTDGDMAVGFGARETLDFQAQAIANVDGIPAFIASGSLSAAASVTSRVAALPAGTLRGDLVIAHCASENNDVHSCATAGWNKLGQTDSGAGWTVSHWWAVETGSLSGPTITWTNAADASARTHAYRDAKADGASCAYLGTVGAGIGSTHTSTGGNTTSDDSLAIYVDHANGSTALATPSSWTEDTDSGSPTGPVRTGVGHKGLASGGTGSGNISVTGTNAAWVQQQIEIFHADNGDQTERVNFAHSALGEVMSVVTEPADVYNTFGWTCSGGALTATTAGAFVLRAAKSLVLSPQPMQPFLMR